MLPWAAQLEKCDGQEVASAFPERAPETVGAPVGFLYVVHHLCMLALVQWGSRDLFHWLDCIASFSEEKSGEGFE